LFRAGIGDERGGVVGDPVDEDVPELGVVVGDYDGMVGTADQPTDSLIVRFIRSASRATSSVIGHIPITLARPS
jgi:hypothetical protein